MSCLWTAKNRSDISLSYTKKLELEVISSAVFEMDYHSGYFGFYSDPFRRFLVFSFLTKATPPTQEYVGPSW